MALVLIVDVDKSTRDLLEKHLSRAGYQTAWAARADEGFALALAAPPDLIILDNNLPEVTGFQMCGWFRQNPTTESIPIVMMTDTVFSPNQQETARNLGANDCVVKPFNVTDVVNLVHTLMGPKRPTVVPLSPPEATPAAPDLAEKAQANADKTPQPEEPRPVEDEPLPPPTEDFAGFSDFSLKVLILASRLERNHSTQHAAEQLLKFGTSAGEKMIEAKLADSLEERCRLQRAALRDLHVAAYWLDLIRRSKFMSAGSFVDLEAECKNLTMAVEEAMRSSQPSVNINLPASSS